MKIRHLALAAVVGALLMPVAFAQNGESPRSNVDPSEPSSSTTDPAEPSSQPFPGWDFHNHNRAIAFGSLILAGQESANIDNWKEVKAYGWCGNGGPIAGSSGESSSSAEPGSNGKFGEPGLDCWTIYVTTSYDLFECPDGRAYILRGGVGVSLETRHTGSVFSWGEAVACSASSSGNVESGNEIETAPDVDSLRALNGKAELRPFDPRNIRRLD